MSEKTTLYWILDKNKILRLDVNGKTGDNIICAQEIEVPPGTLNKSNLADFEKLILAIVQSGTVDIESVSSTKSALEKPLSELDLSVRAYNVLKAAKAYTLGEIIATYKNGEILKFRNVGKKTLTEVEELCKSEGFPLK